MIEYKRSTIRTWSILGSRGTFGVVLKELADLNPDICALSADLCNTSGLDRFKNAYPERFVNVGIAEQNLIGVSAGMAEMGNIPFVTTFSNFACLRSCEQMRHFMGYMQENVKVVGLAAGFAMGMFGITHYGLEDIAAIRAIPNITILSPADCTETAKLTELAVIHQGPVYLRLTGVMNCPIVYHKDYEAEIGKGIVLQEGQEIAIIATGTMVSPSIKTANKLEKEGISCTVVDMHTIKPIDTELLDQLKSVQLIVTVEEHSVTGGLGSAIAEHYSKIEDKPPQLIIGVEQGYKPAGDYYYGLEINGLTEESIYNTILKRYKEI